MAAIDLTSITEPISDEQPCGPDLDMEFDMDFMNFMAEIEGDLPTSYFKFESSGFKFDNYYDRIGKFLERTRDIRLLVPLAKLRILQGDLEGFSVAIQALAGLLTTRWADVHPQPMDGDYSLRTGYLYTLDDNPNCVLPLQHTAIIRSRRSGAITLRKWQVANGDVNAREGEETLSGDTVLSELAEADAEVLAKVTEQLEAVRDGLSAIRKVAIEEAGYDNAPAYERLPQAVDAMLELIGRATGKEQAPVAGEEGEAADGGSGTVLRSVVLPPGAVASRQEAKDALHIAARYFALNEPSSPCQVLLREAEAAIDKGFYSLVYELMPSAASSAVIRLGREPFFELSLADLDSRNPAPDYSAEVAEPATESWEETGLGDDESVSEELDGDNGTAASTEEPALEEGQGEPGEIAELEADTEVQADANAEAAEEPAEETAAESVSEEPVEDAVVESTAQPEEEGPKFWANSRPEAVALMEKVVAYYRVAEPTSPVPLLLERAIDMSSKSFMDLLGSVLPQGSLKTTKSDTGSSW